MALSNSTDFNVTRDQVITGALRLVGAIAQGETPTAAMITEGSEALNMLAKAWQADGMPLWVMKEYTLTLVNGQNTYTVDPKLLKVIQAWNRDKNSKVDIPMRIVTNDEYNRLGNKTTSGNPIQIYHEPRLTTSTLKVFPTPTALEATNNEIHLVYQKQFDDFDGANDNPEFPSEYFAALKFNLADHLAFEYGMEMNDKKQLEAKALNMKLVALSFGTEEGSTYFGIERRGQ